MIYINGVFVVTCLVAWFLFFVYTLFKAIDSSIWDRYKILWVILCFSIFVVPLGLGLGSLSKFNNEHPCLEIVKEMRYNPATKTVMPMSVCVKRGTWIEE